jgi:ABC-type phosphate transport system substrate-binding protein
MKTNQFYQLLLAIVLSVTGISAQNNVNEPVIISGTKFTYPIIEKWIAEYAKVNPASIIQLSAKPETRGTADLSIIAHQPATDELKEGQEIIYAGRYALLPVTNSNNPLLNTSKKRGINKKDIDKLFFEVENYDDEPAVEKTRYRATIYTSDNNAGASTTLAKYYGHVSTEIKGKKVFGDDIYLLSAIRKDTFGIAFNNLGYLFDVNTRNLKAGIAIIPLDLKKEAKPITTGNLDEVISILETNKIETIPVEEIGFIYSRQNVRREVAEFLKWVLTDGQKFNHEKGFLTLDKQELAEQNSKLSEKFLTLK